MPKLVIYLHLIGIQPLLPPSNQVNLSEYGQFIKLVSSQHYQSQLILLVFIKLYLVTEMIRKLQPSYQLYHVVILFLGGYK
jgi:hypothetical protein